MAYTVHQAKTHFSKLLKEVESGKEVIVMRGKKPVARLVPMEHVEQPAKEPEPKENVRLLGEFRGKISWTEDAFDPISEEELTEWGIYDSPFDPPRIYAAEKKAGE